tara:strand:- start:1075 stop:1854 length:780 start_codon:yes stop_codon:yes gene_type:complete
MDNKKLTEYSDLARSTLSDLSEIFKQKRKDGFRVIRKEKRELVTELDVFVQNFIKERFTREIGSVEIVSEEMRENLASDQNYWSIDPIDGTHNFVAGLPYYGVSAAYIEQGEVLIGVISLPDTNTIYHAIKGLGAFENDKKLTVSNVDDLSKSIVAYDNQFHLSSNMIDNFISLTEECFTTRIHGCSVIDASYVAKGLLSARIYNSTKLCDIAAGIILVKESGGIASDFTGDEIDLSNPIDVVFSAPAIHKELISILKK